MEEEDIQIDFSEWTVVDEDVGDSSNLSRKTNTNTKTQNTRRSTNIKEPVKNANPKSVSKPQNSSSATNKSPKENSNKVILKGAAKSTTSSGANNTGRNVVSSNTSEVSKNVVESVTSTRTSDSGKNKVESTSEKAAPSGESHESCNKSPQDSKTTNSSTIHSQHGTTEVSCVETVQVTSLKDTPGGSSSISDIASSSGSTATKSVTDIAAVTQVTSSSTSAPLKEGRSEVATAPLSTNSTAKPVAATSNMTPAASTVSSSAQLTSQTTSSRTLVKSNMKNKVRTVESIAEIMAAVGKENARSVHCDVGGMEDVSDAELTDTADLTKSKSKVAGMKRDASPNKGGPPIKKTKSSAVLAQVSSVPAARDQPVKKDQDSGNQNQKNPKQQTQGNKTENNLKPSPRNQLPGGMSSTPKGSFGSAKTAVTKAKTPPAVSPITVKTPTAPAAAKTTDVENKPATTTSTTVKRIIRRFHRMTQTAITERSNKLVHCLIKVPSLDAPPKPNCHSEVQVSIEKETKDEVFYQRALPETVKPEIFKVVSAFNLNDTGSRNIIITGSYGYGISLGHVTASDVEKSTFRENLLAKSACYRLYLDKQDYGVVDLFFGEEDHFVTVLTQIRKMRMGPRHLVVTYYKNLKENECDPEFPISSVKATIIYNQNFATTNFLAHTKAPLWNKPKVEEILTIHNMPEGIPLDFLKTIIPDAITVEMEDKNQKFTQKGSRVHLGLDRKNGGDSFLKLFAQMYVNNECLAFSVLYTPLSAVPELTDILKEKKKRESEMRSLRELKAVPRDISATRYVGEEEQVDVIMQVDTVVKDVLSYLTPAKTRPSTVQKLKQPVCPPESNKTSTVNKSVRDSVLSDVSNEFSDISEASNVGGEAGVSKTSQKNTSGQRKPTSVLKRTTRIQHKVSSPREKTEKTFSRREPLTGVNKSTFRKTYVSRINDRRREIRDRFQDKDRKSSLSKPLDFTERIRGIRGIRSVRPERHDDRRGPSDRDSRTSNSDRGKERPTHRQNTSEDRVRDEPEPIRDRILKDRPRVDIPRRDSFDRLSGNRDHGRNAEDRGRHGHTASRTERIRRRSEEKDNRRVRVSSTTDRHGNKIVGLHLRREAHRAAGSFQDNVTEEFSVDRVDQVAYNEREIRKGNRLDLLVQRRLHILEKEEKEVNDSREVILTRSRSPVRRQVHRGRTTSPRRYQPVSATPGRMRQASPVYGNQQRFNAGRRSRSPRQADHNPVLSPISAGEDEAGDSLEGMWLPQPPATQVSQQDTRKGGLSARSSNYAKTQAEWKSQGSPDETEKESYSESQSKKFIEQFVEQVIGTGMSSTRPGISSEKRSPKPFNDPAKVIEKIREIYNSTVNVRENVSDDEDDDVLHSAVTRGGQNRSRPAERVGPVASRSTVRASSNISSSSSHGAESKPVDRFERRDSYERNKRGAGDAQRFDDSGNSRKFDAPGNNRGRAFGREAGTTPLQKNSGGYVESRVSNQSIPDRFQGKGILKNSTTGEYQDSGMQDQPHYGQYREPENSDWKNSGGYSEFGMENPGGYREPEAPFRQNPGGYRESEAPFRQNSGGFRESEAPFRQNSGGYRDSDSQNHPGFGAFHPNQQLQSPIPPPVVPPLHHNPIKSAQEKFAELESMANMVAASMEHHHGPDSFGQGMWNEGPQQDPIQGPQQFNTGPQQYPAGPQFNFPGPQAAHGPNMNFSGPRHPPIQPPNNQFVRGVNPQPPPWHHNNFF
ncbi:hypothetical protein BsWGS_05698 [Bradybaena similaris]